MAFKRNLALIGIAVLASFAGAQNKVNARGEMIGERWVGAMGVTETSDEIMAREKPYEGLFNLHTKAEIELEFEKKQNPASPKVAFWPPRSNQGPLTSGGKGGSIGPRIVGVQWDGALSSESPYEPPDSNGAVGPNHVVVAVNGRIKAYTKAGSNAGLLNTSTDSFFNSVRNASGISDPQVRYDPISQRWFLIAINVDFANNRIVIARSADNTPTSWTFFYLQQENVAPAGNTNQLADYPSLGVDANALYIGANMFTTTAFQGSSCFVIQKTSILGAGPIVASAFRNVTGGTSAGPYSPRGVDNWDPTSTEGYFIGVDVATFGKLYMRRVSSPGSGTPTMSANLAITVPSTTNPQDPPQSGTGTVLDSIDDRLYAARISKNTITGVTTLWTAHHFEVDATGVANSAGNREGCRWYQIGTLTGTPTLIQSGTLFDPAASNPRWYVFPSITQTGQGHSLLGSTVTAANLFPSTQYASRLRTDGLGTIGASSTTTSGTSAYTGTRWGDYSETVVDPTDNMTVWTFQEYCSSGWRVRVTQLKAPAPAAITTLAPNNATQGQTLNVTVTGTSTGGTEFYDPGTGIPNMNRLQASFSGTGITVNSFTFNGPTSVTLNITLAANATTGLRNLTITNPDGQSVTANNVFTVNAATVNVNPDTITTTIGEYNAGGLSEIANSDNVYYTAFNDALTLTCEITMSSNSAPTVGGTPTIVFSIESNVARLGLQQRVEFYDQVAAAWVNMGGAGSSTADTTQVITVNSNSARFVNNGTHNVRARIRWTLINDENPTQDGWLHSIDRAYWTITP